MLVLSLEFIGGRTRKGFYNHTSETEGPTTFASLISTEACKRVSTVLFSRAAVFAGGRRISATFRFSGLLSPPARLLGQY